MQMTFWKLLHPPVSLPIDVLRFIKTITRIRKKKLRKYIDIYSHTDKWMRKHWKKTFKSRQYQLYKLFK